MGSEPSNESERKKESVNYWTGLVIAIYLRRGETANVFYSYPVIRLAVSSIFWFSLTCTVFSGDWYRFSPGILIFSSQAEQYWQIYTSLDTVDWPYYVIRMNRPLIPSFD